jgi:cytokinin dehydrogenase
MTPTWVGEVVSALRHVQSRPAQYRDFGGSTHEAPCVLIRTESSEEVQRVLELAARYRISVAVRGAGHSSGGQTSAPAGIVLKHEPQEDIEISGEAFEVPGYWPWHRVEQSLREQDRDLMVATSALDTTVAGTLSMGGFGVRSVARGAQVDHVLGLELICVDGRTRWCSPTSEPDLFSSALTGAGQVGIINRVRMTCTVGRAFLACNRARYRSFAELAAAISWMEDPAAEVPDYFSALLKDGMLESVAATAHESESEAAGALDRVWQRGASDVTRYTSTRKQYEADERDMPVQYWWGCRNIWCDYCLDAEGFSNFARFADEHLWHVLRGHLAYVMCIAPRASAPYALDMRPKQDRRFFSLGLFFSVPGQNASDVQDALLVHRRALKLCIQLGGRPYLYGCWGGRYGLEPETLAMLYGSGYERLRRVRARVDPDGVLNPNALAYDSCSA